jgi:mercuric ion transport protein
MRARSLLSGAQASKPEWLLALAATLSLLASACCVLPLLLVALGLSAAWLVPMHSLTSYWPLFIAGALVVLVLAKRRMTCECAARNTIFFWAIVMWTGVTLLVPIAAPLFY